MSQLCVYILECSDKSYYVGVTNNIERRLLEHNNSEVEDSYTFLRRPVQLKWVSENMDPNQAIELEKALKKWTRKKKEALISENWDLLKTYSKCQNETSHEFYKKPFDSAQGDS